MSVDISSLKAGDEVGIADRYHAAVRKVAKVTATTILLDDGSRWGKNGRKHGHRDSWNWWSIIPVEKAHAIIDEKKRETLQYDLAQRLLKTSNGLSADQLARIKAIVEEPS